VLVRNWIAALGTAFSILIAPSWAGAETDVDLALVLAVDVSRSMDPDEQQLQRAGYVEAFRSEVVHTAIRKGVLGRIAVAYVEWSGPTEQRIIVPWTVVEGDDGAAAFADRLNSAPISRVFSTSISGAIDYGVKLLGESGVEALRRVIDISGDGPNNTGRPVMMARDEAVAKGITINGLPFMLKKPSGFGDIENLDHYYQDCVIGGPGAFVVPIRERNQIADATRTNLVREIADARDTEPLVQPAQSREPINCLVGETQRRQQWGP
jgi:hypothetical protein